MSVISSNGKTSTIPNALQNACAIADESRDLAGFLAAAGDDLDPETARECEYLLQGIRQVLAGLVAKIEQAGPR